MSAAVRSSSRRGFLKGAGALVVAFRCADAFAQAPQLPRPKLPGSLDSNRMLDSWIRIEADRTVTVFTGKVEFGQGIGTALSQIAADELDVAMSRVRMVAGDTARTPNEGYTSGSQSMQDGGTALRFAAAEARGLLLALAAARLDAPKETLSVEDGTVRAQSGASVTYWDLVSGRYFQHEATGSVQPKKPDQYKIIGKPTLRLDIPSKVTGAPTYVQNLRMPRMLHARVVRPPSYGARLASLDTKIVEKMPGVVKLVRDGSFIGVLANREEQAIAAASRIAKIASWSEPQTLPDSKQIFQLLTRLPSHDQVIANKKPDGADMPSPARTREATFHRPYQMHGSIGPSCAVALMKEGALTVWTHNQGVFPLRQAIAELVRLPENRVRCIHMEGAGCYGHNGADDAAADAALLAVAVPDRPIRVQWSRNDEHTWEPYGSAMVMHAKAGLDGDGNVVTWNYDVWSSTHSTRPGGAGSLLAAWHLEQPFSPPPPSGIPQPAGGGDRNAIPFYAFPTTLVTHRFIPTMPLRVSALRSLGAFGNVFAIESFMDELAKDAGADPVAFRLKHLRDPRAQAVVQRAADVFGWSGFKSGDGRGRGFAFARYKNLAAYTAVAMEVEVDRSTGAVRLKRAVAANDSGQVVNPDGLKLQIEGGILQSSSWTLKEAVTFDRTRITSRDWSGYPILTFSEVPEVDVQLIDRPGEPFLGTGEAAQGPTGAAIANAVADACGARVREIPLTPDRVKAAIG